MAFPPDPTRWSSIVPELEVKDIVASQAWYSQVLGASIAWTWKDGFGAVYHGDVELFFRQADAPAPSRVYIRVPDADMAYKVYTSRGGIAVAPPEKKPWGMLEFSLRDPDGHLLRVGHPLK